MFRCRASPSVSANPRDTVRTGKQTLARARSTTRLRRLTRSGLSRVELVIVLVVFISALGLLVVYIARQRGRMFRDAKQTLRNERRRAAV